MSFGSKEYVRGLARLRDELEKANVAFRSATEPFDTTTPAGRMMVQMLGFIQTCGCLSPAGVSAQQSADR